MRGQTVTYTISGSFTTVPGNTLGLVTAPTAFSGTMTINLAANTSSFHVAAGDTLDGQPAAHDFYGFSSSSIVSMSFTTGSITWTQADLDPMRGEADFLASTNLTTAPVYVGIAFKDGDDNSFSIGTYSVGLTQSSLDNALHAYDSGTGNDALGTYSVSAVPEPSTYAAIFGAMVLLGTMGWKRRRTV